MITGRCQCGAVRYEHSGTPSAIYICHCRECQRQSASAFGVSVEVDKFGLRVIQGAPKFWTRDTDSGKRLRCAFCPDCGTNLYFRGGKNPDVTGIAIGCFDDPHDMAPVRSVWEQSRHPWVTVPAHQHFERGRP